MPALPRQRVSVLRDLIAELRFTPAPALIRHVLRAEALVSEIDPERVYTESEIVRRLTGFRRENAASGTMVPGEALRADLSAWCERITLLAGRAGGDVETGTLTLAEVCKRWSVSRRTVERYRELGLLARRAGNIAGRERLVFARKVVDAFESANEARLGLARKYSRVTRAEQAKLGERAARLIRAGAKKRYVATRLAERSKRSVGSVRRVMRDRGLVRSRVVQLDAPSALDAWRRGRTVAAIASASMRSSAAVRRAIVCERHRRVAEAISLIPESVRAAGELIDEHDPRRLVSDAIIDAPGDVVELIAQMRRRENADLVTERARGVAAANAVARAALALARTPPLHPREFDLDEAETLLRTALRLYAAQLRVHLNLVWETLTTSLGEPPDEIHVPARDLAMILTGAIDVAAGAMIAHVPGGRGRVAAPITLEVSKFAAKLRRKLPVVVAARASPLHHSGHPVARWSWRIAPWQVWLDPDEHAWARLGTLEDSVRVLVVARFGWGGGLPRTCAALAHDLGTSPAWTQRRLHEAIRVLYEGVK